MNSERTQAINRMVHRRRWFFGLRYFKEAAGGRFYKWYTGLASADSKQEEKEKLLRFPQFHEIFAGQGKTLLGVIVKVRENRWRKESYSG